MEIKTVVPEDLAKTFQSKQDLYNILTVDLKYFLPPFEKCSMHFIRKALSGEKKMIKAEKVCEIIVPRYKELSVESIWPLIKEADDLYSYFPDYYGSQLPDRRFMYAILGTFRGEMLAQMINDARKQRSVSQNQEANDLIYVESKILTEIKSVMNQKVTKGKAVYLLRKSAKLQSSRKKAKQYFINFDNIQDGKEEEEKKGQDDMN